MKRDYLKHLGFSWVPSLTSQKKTMDNNTQLREGSNDLQAKGDNLARTLRRLSLSVQVHPDFDGNPTSEWGSLIESAEQFLAEWKGEKEPVIGGMPQLPDLNLKDLTSEQLAVLNKTSAKMFLKEKQQGAIWVKASERMPEHNVGVLVLIPGEDNHITSGMWDIDNKWVLLDEYRVPDCEVTHWMSLPGLPEGVESNDLPDELGQEIKKIARKELGFDESAGKKDGVLKVGLKFRSKVAPLCSYEVVKIFPETKEFKVKETRECEVSGTTCYEVWSIEGFEKYYDLGVYYIQKEVKP